MRLSFIVAGVLATAVGITVTQALHSPVWAQGAPPTGQTATPNAQPSAMPEIQPSITEATGQLKTDASKASADVKAMDVNKVTQDAGQVNKDVEDLKGSAKGMLTNPFGK